MCIRDRPGGGTLEKPVGLVYVAVKRGDYEFCKMLDLGGRNRDRQTIRSRSAAHALYLALMAAKRNM